MDMRLPAGPAEVADKPAAWGAVFAMALGAGRLLAWLAARQAQEGAR